MKSQPWVTVICICYNQAAYVKEALESILAQTYKNIEIIVCDDASTDQSQVIIEDFIKNFQNIYFIKQTENIGNCKLFNKAFARSKGDFIIDLAADDLLMPERISSGISRFLLSNEKVGVQYCQVKMIDKSGNTLLSSKPVKEGKTGDVYIDLITDYLVNPAGMMMKRIVLSRLNGYDEKLTYEDFDFWIRSAREFEYDFIGEVLVKKRILQNSLSSGQFKIINKHGKSTLMVCQKIFDLNREKSEDLALVKRLKYEVKMSIRTLNFNLAAKYLNLLKKVKKKLR